MAVRTMGIPGLEFFRGLYGKDIIHLDMYEDNAATKAIIESGRNPKLRHVLRTQKVNVKWLHDVFNACADVMKIVTCPTKEMKADIFTKAFPEPKAWVHACDLIGLKVPSDVSRSPSRTEVAMGVRTTRPTPILSLTAAYSGITGAITRIGERCCQFCCPQNMQVVHTQ